MPEEDIQRMNGGLEIAMSTLMEVVEGFAEGSAGRLDGQESLAVMGKAMVMMGTICLGRATGLEKSQATELYMQYLDDIARQLPEGESND